VEDSEAEMYWLQFSDFLEWPHIQLFDSLAHLKVVFFLIYEQKNHQFDNIELYNINCTTVIMSQIWHFITNLCETGIASNIRLSINSQKHAS
jgi:hypothetical protein